MYRTEELKVLLYFPVCNGGLLAAGDENNLFDFQDFFHSLYMCVTNVLLETFHVCETSFFAKRYGEY